MTRLIFYIALSLAITAGATWLISLPGTLSIDVVGYRLQPGLGATGVALVLAIALSIGIWAIVRRLVEAPKRLARMARQRRKEIGVEALSDSIIAMQAGDATKARRLAREAQIRLPQNAAAQLLEARADLALGDLGPAREHYRALISNDKTSLAALAGLYEQARAQGRADVAITFARKAHELSPAISWSQTAVFDDLTGNASWQEALEMINVQPTPNRDARAKKRRKQAVLHTAIAAHCETTDPDLAMSHATAAIKLQPEFVPAALISARIHINRAETRKAASLLRRMWRATSHPHVATLYANAQPGTSAIERLKRVRDLIESKPVNQSAAIVLVRAAIDAYEWSTARNALARFLGTEPSQAVCMLMAEIEEGQNGDQGKAREWLARAVHAPRDPTWIADGITSNEWEPVSPVTGKLDAFAWKAPVRAVSTTREISDEEQPALEIENRSVPALPPATN